MDGLLETPRVYSELGSIKELQGLIDNPPLFIHQTDILCKPFSASTEAFDSRIYVFDRAVVIARKRDEKKNVEFNPILFTDVPKIEPELNSNQAVQSSFEQSLYLEKDKEDQMKKLKGAEYHLEFYATLDQCYPSVYFDKNSKSYILVFTQISNRESKAEDCMVVDRVEYYVDEFFVEKIKVVMGLLQENMVKLFRIPLTRGNLENSLHRSMMKRRSRTKQRTGKRGSRQREVDKIQNKIRKSSKNNEPSSVVRSSVKEVNTDHTEEIDMDDTGDFKVIFGPHIGSKGFKVNSQNIVSEVLTWGLADAAGVCVGDKLEKVLKGSLEHLDFPEAIVAVFSRTRAEEIKLHNRSEAYKSDGSGSRPSFDASETEQIVEVFFRRLKRADAIPKFGEDSDEGEDAEKEEFPEFVLAATKKLKHRCMQGKGKVWTRLRNGTAITIATTKSDLEKKIIEKEKADVKLLFKKLLSTLDSKKEKGCVFQLQEIYDTEVKYLDDLHKLVEAREIIAGINRNLSCKETKGGGIFCEHKKVRRLCKQQSKETSQAVSNEDLDKVFLNVKSLINVHVRIECGLRKNIVKMYARLEAEKEVTVEDLLAVFCNEFTAIAPFLSMYTQYIQRFSTAVTEQKLLRQGNTHFSAGINQVEAKYSMRFGSLINRPVQRITKYPLLFSSLESYLQKFIKEAESSNSDKPSVNNFIAMRESLTIALSTVKKVVDKVNEKVGAARDLEIMTRIYEEIGGKNKVKNLLEPWRRFKAELILPKFYFGSDSSLDEPYEDCVVFIFSDMVVGATKIGRVHRRGSITSTVAPGVSKAAKRAGHLVGSTLGRSSMRLLSSAANSATKTGSRLSRFKRSKTLKGKKKATQKVSKKNAKDLQHFLNSSSKVTSRNKLSRAKSTRGTNLTKSPSRRRKISAGSSARTSRRRTSKNSRVTKTGEKQQKVRDLDPVAEVKIANLSAPRLSKEDLDDELELFVLTYDFDDPESTDSDSEDDFKLVLYFKTEKTRSEVEKLINEIQEDIKRKRNDWVKIREVEDKRKKSGLKIQEAI